MDAAGGQLECFAARLWENVKQLDLDELSMAYGEDYTTYFPYSMIYDLV